MKTSLALIIATLASIVQVSADSATYHTFGSSNTIARFNEDGEASLHFPLPFIASFTQPSGLAVDAGAKRVYYSRLSFIGSVNLDGTGNFRVKDLLAGNNPSHLEIDEGNGLLYFYVNGSTHGTMERGIYRMSTDGSGVTAVMTGTLLAALDPPVNPLISSTAEDGMVLDAENGLLYWSDARRLFRTPLATLDPVVVGTFPFNFRSFEIDTVNGKLYYSDNTHIERSELDGSSAVTIYNPGFGFPSALEVDPTNGRLYFVQARKVKYVTLDGTSVVEVRGTAFDGATDIEVGPLPDLAEPKIVSAVPVVSGSGTRLRISHTTDPGINYTFQSSATLLAGSWTSTGTTVIGDGTVMSSDFLITGSQKYFRVRREDPCE